MTVKANMNGLATAASDRGTIPVVSRRVGSWHLEISRRIQASAELTNQYDAAAKKWARTTRRFQLEAAYRDALTKSGATVTLAKSGPEVQALDCGIGTGSLSLALNSIRPKQIAYHGIDISEEMLATADIAMRQAGLSPTLGHGDILSIPYADQSFDLVMAAHVLEHLPEPRRALIEMKRVLKPGGLLLVCITKRSVFGTLIQLRWRTWAVTEQQGAGWLRDCQLSEIGFLPLRLCGYAGQSSMAFWGRRPG